MSIFGLVDKFNNALVNSNLSEINVNGVISTVKSNLKEGIDLRSQLLTIKSLNKDYNNVISRELLVDLLDLFESTTDNHQLELLLDTLLNIFEINTKSTKSLLSNNKFSKLLDVLVENYSTYTKLYAIQIINLLLLNYKTLTINELMAKNGLSNLIQLLDYSNFIRSETLIILLYITDYNSELQKIAAFEGIFDKLFKIILSEGSIDGTIIVQDCLHCIQNLLRYNSSNITFFREMGFVKNLTHTLLYSPDNLDSFSLQYWSEQKVVNAAIVIDIVRIIAGLGNRQGNLSILQSGLTQCLIDLSLSSNAPVTLKAQTLTALTAIFSTSPQNQQFFTQSQTQPILNSDAYAAGYLRLPPRLATISLIDIALNGESGDENRMVDDVDSLKGHNLMFQVAALSAFESLITSNDSLKLEIIASMSHTTNEVNYDGSITHTAGSLLLEALSNLPTPEVSLDGAFDSQKVFFASLVLSHVLRYSEDARAMARNIPFNPSEDTDEDETVSLLHGIFGNLITCSRERAAADARLREKEFSSINRTEEPEKQGNQENEEEEVKQIDIDWTRLTVSYLILLSVWVWDSPATVSDILKESSNLQVLIQPIKQSSGVDALIQGLCAFTFGAIYKFNTGPSEVSKKDLHSIIEKQIGVDNIIQSLARFRSDKRFCKIGSPDDALAYAETPQEDGWWFDWNYVEFFKGSFMAVQRSVISEEIEETTKVAPPLPQASSPLPESTDNTDHEKVVQEKDSQIETHKQRIEELKVKNANMEMEMERVNNELGEAKSKLQALWEQGSPEVAGLRGDLAEGVKREETLRAELDKLNNELETLKQKEGEHKSASGELTTKIEILENEVKSNKEEVLRLKEQNDGLKSTNERDTNEIQSTKNTNETLQKENEHLKTQLEKHIESEKEHEDLLILLEDMSTKRSNDKNRMKQAGLEVSEDEGDEDDDE
ncbi:hypothetical protein E3Q23_01832 [Wallemia mellicola]|uniref:Vesicle tethering protein Uso1/P115-like head domain-containing protein n=1 Tax=Wallemia mellicola TaxID=1708541 RepID=A0A4T0M2X0_9BASI|nr:hypothetical protein E3Q23_01832 [Wallemia mellicola]TIC25874.1 hypothetical protein E3Q12_00698 [Wallemia mellicola]TIC65952.1 hypothetical protein E3Q01_01893 [Wallemia mellicola]